MNDKQNKTDFLQNLKDKPQFVQSVQNEIKRRAFNELEVMKRDIASSFINSKK